MSEKVRLSASVDADLLEAAKRAVAAGKARNVSAWVNDALRLKMQHEQRRQALAELVADYEKEHGDISPEEMKAASRRARSGARTVRPAGPVSSRRRPGRGPK